MSDQTMREAKLIQYLNEAYGKERHLETALQAHIEMTTRDSYKKRLQAHLKETKQHARDVQKRIKQLGGTAEEISIPVPSVAAGAAARVQTVARKGAALAQGPLHMLHGTGEAEKLLKNAKTEYANEAEEIATYTAIEALALAVNDRETAQLAKRIRREEERMASFLEKLIPTLTRAVATDEIPAAERRNGAGRTRRTTTRRATATASGGRSTSSRTTSRSASTSGRSTARGTPRSASASSRSASASGRSTARRTSASGKSASSRAASRPASASGRSTSRSPSRPSASGRSTSPRSTTRSASANGRAASARSRAAGTTRAASRASGASRSATTRAAGSRSSSGASRAGTARAGASRSAAGRTTGSSRSGSRK